MRFFSSVLLLLALPAVPAHASAGDRSPEYQACLARCTRASCDPATGAPLHPPLPLALRLTRWSCADNCAYTCMHALTDLAAESGVRAQQFHGKWPFWRVLGAQEPAAAVFSFANLLVHVQGADWARRALPRAHPMRPFYLAWAYISINAWAWSTVFHTRDTRLTERLDYFSAGLAILYGLYMSAVRLFHLYPGSAAFPSRRARRPLLAVWRAACALAYAAHVAYLALPPRFDYAYNVRASLAVGLAHHLLWLAFALPARATLFPRYAAAPRAYRPPHAGAAARGVLLLCAATALELLDFPAWRRAVDAHALWHLATVPLAVLWWDFLIVDAQDPAWRGVRE
ncbi:Per1-like protein [Gloeopeniophorella convolvens]|nr:Per1-like protein [Gloeopeniophorella convolvens]